MTLWIIGRPTFCRCFQTPFMWIWSKTAFGRHFLKNIYLKWSYLSSERIVSIKSDWRVWWLDQQPVGRNLERGHAGVQQSPRYRFTWKTKHYLLIIQWAPLNGITRLMGSFSLWDLIAPDLPVPNYSFIRIVGIYLAHLLIVFIHLL